jgi:hypothetical protein
VLRLGSREIYRICPDLPLLHGDLIVETELDLGDRSARFRVETDPILCEHLNGDIGNLHG